MDSVMSEVWNKSPLIDIKSGNYEFDEIYRYIREFSIDIMTLVGEEGVKIGTIHASFFHARDIINNRKNLMLIAETVSQEAYDAIYAITDKEGRVIPNYCGIGGNVLFIDTIHVNEEYRGLGVGKRALTMLKPMLYKMFGIEFGCIVLQPYPIELKEDGQLAGVSQTEKRFMLLRNDLRHLYSSLGFRPTAKDKKHYYFNTDCNMTVSHKDCRKAV